VTPTLSDATEHHSGVKLWEFILDASCVRALATGAVSSTASVTRCRIEDVKKLTEDA